jgi:HlyD family secretion protein
MKRLWVVAAMVAAGACGRFEKTADSGVIEVSGRIEGDETDLAFKTSGRVKEILVREGDAVQAGQVVARLAGEQERIRLKEAEARLLGARARVEQARLQIPVIERRVEAVKLAEEQAEQDAPSRVRQAEAQAQAGSAELKRAEADLEQMRMDADRYAGLAGKGAAPRQTAEQYRSRVASAEAAVEAVRRQVEAAMAGVEAARATLQAPRIRAMEAQTLMRQSEEASAAVRLAEADVAVAAAAVERARQDVEELELRAPVAGRVITRAAEPGRVVGPGMTVLTVVDTGALYMRAFVPEGRIGLVKLGQRAEVFLDSSPDQGLEAEVVRVDPQAMFTPENTYFKEDRIRQVVGVKLGLKDATGSAKPGMPADGKIHVR